MQQKKEYNYTFSILMALGIIMVVAGHLDYGILTWNNLFPYYSFHMGMFMFISGYFYKAQNEQTLFQYIIKKIRRLIIPYFLWNLFYGILVLVLQILGFSMGEKLSLYTLFVQPFIDGHQFYFNLASWFVPALFLVEVVYICLMKLIKKLVKRNDIALLLLCGLLFAGGVFFVELAKEGYDHSFWLIVVRTGFFLPIYCLGDVYKEILEAKDKVKNGLYFLVIVGIQLIIYIHYGWIPTFSAVFAVFFENPVMQYLTIILGIALWLRIAKIITPIVDKNGCLIYIGKHTFFIMMNHITAIYVIMLTLVGINKLTGLFADINLQQIMGEASRWYCPNGNTNFLLLYLWGSIALCVGLCKLGDRIRKMLPGWIRSFLYNSNIGNSKKEG